MGNRVKKEYLIQDSYIIDNIYSEVSNSLKSKVPALKKCIEKFVHNRHDQLYDYAPIDRIFFKKTDIDDFFKSLNIDMKEITDVIHNLYYWKDDELAACKDEFSLTCLMALRYILKEKKGDKNLTELVGCYLAFSGKFYATLHYNYWREYVPKREVMDYVVNYMLSQKFDLVKTGSVWGMIKNLVTTWIETYGDELSSDLTDERIVYIIHQLHNRIGSCLKNIANAYYDAWNKKLYLNAESDSYDKENYRIANNNATLAEGITEKTMTYITSTTVNINICYKVSSSGVDPYDIKSIFENIISNNKKLSQLRNLVNILITDFMNSYPDEKDYTGPKFIAHSIAMKPNTKDKNIIELKNTVLEWLNTSERYRNIKTPATKNNYYKAILAYVAITVNIANKEV